ncbi:hypothetical protein RHS04_06807 [Rhizoctonia solani]|uniref:Phosphatidate phosphatase APP1 catalytic domain-containing protein n=1 Tax=Rhizoctonia solani TaxID=456999 RepID=A0A8H7LFH7_9AGAM|nr:hypothetical protein RHS04_06807 [Rhizoctonia solani]
MTSPTGRTQRLHELFNKLTSRTSPQSPSNPTITDGYDKLPLTTRLIAFDNTAFYPPHQPTCAAFPSAICPSTQPNANAIPPKPSEFDTHIAEFVIAYMSSRSGDAGILDDIVANIVSILGIVKRNGPEEENVRSRVAMFLGFMKVNERAVLVSRSLEAAIGEQVVLGGPSSGNGISSDLRWLRAPRGTREIVWKVLTSSEDQRVFEARTFVPADSGWVVISDVDDTIKVSQVNNRIALLRNTFVADPSAVPGMPELYASLNTQLNNPSWFYLSASPWQLYPFLHDFLNAQGRFPRGQLILRDMSRGAMPVYLSALTMGTQAYKVDRLSKVHEWLPEPARRVVLIGDSTQKDPESYGEIARKWPNWVGAIWIRVVQGVDERKEKDLNDPKRFAKAFEKVDSRIWKTFIDPKELQAAVAGLKTN